jgi:hypothetical protein
MSLDDSELENELASLPASRETRWEQVYIDGDTKLVQRGCGDIDTHDFDTQEPKDICITSPPGELESSFLAGKTSDNTPLSLSIVGSLQPIDPQSLHNSMQEPPERGHHRGVGNKKSFSDRVHELAQTQTQPIAPEPTDTPDYYDNRNSYIPDPAVLANLEHDVAMDSSTTSTAPPSRVSTGFSVFDMPEPSTRRVGTGFSIAPGYRMPLHQDSGFAEPERVSYESERIRQSLDESIKDLKYAKEDGARIDERLWDEKEGTLFGEGVRGSELQIKPEPIPNFTVPASPQKKEKQACMSMPPPPLPSVGPRNVLRVDDVQHKALEEKVSDTTIRPPSILIPDFHYATPTFTTTTTTTTRPIAAPAATAVYSSSRNKSPDPDYDDYLSPVEDDEDDDARPASSDLSDYLSHSISFERSLDFYMHERGSGSREPKV